MRAFLVICVSFLLLAGVWAQDEDQDTTAKAAPEETAAQADSEAGEREGAKVFTTTLFPVYNEKKFPAGENVEVLIGFENKNDNDDFEVLYIQGYLVAPYDFSQRIHNFTGTLYNTAVPQYTEASLLYKFKAEAGLIEPRDYGLIISIIYLNKNNDTFYSTAFNSTITITEANSPMDAKTVFTYITLIAIIGLAGFGVYKLIIGKKGGKRKGTTIAKGTDNKGIDWDYISPQHRAALEKSPKGTPKSPATDKKQATPKSPEKVSSKKSK